MPRNTCTNVGREVHTRTDDTKTPDLPTLKHSSKWQAIDFNRNEAEYTTCLDILKWPKIRNYGMS